MKDSEQQRMTPVSLGPRTPIAQLDQREHKSMTVNSSHSQGIVRQVFDTPGSKLTVDIELVSLTDNQNEFNGAELNFLHWLDTEITKIDEFYHEREKVAAERYKIISAQLEALRQLHDSHLTDEWNKGMSTREPSDHGDRSGFRSTWQTLISKFHTLFDRFYSAMPAADHERRVKNPELMAKPITTNAGYVDYRLARRRLKQAILEFYRGMELLKEYRLLNRTALAKILKKFDKIAGRTISGKYVDKLKSVHFDQSDELETLLEQTEV